MSPILGTEVTRTIQGSVVRFREPSFRAFLVRIVPKLGFLSKVLPSTNVDLMGEDAESQDANVTSFLTRLMADDHTWEVLTGFLEVCSDKPAEFFKDITLTEAFEIYEALRKLNLSKVYAVFQQAVRPSLPKTPTAVETQTA